jgi:hypothetical protein
LSLTISGIVGPNANENDNDNDEDNDDDDDDTFRILFGDNCRNL